MTKRRYLLGLAIIVAGVGLVLQSVLASGEWSNYTYPCNGQGIARPTQRQVKAVIGKHEDRFWDHPDVVSFGAAPLLNPDGNRTVRLGIIVHLNAHVNQLRLPQEMRIPSWLDRIPLQWQVGTPAFVQVLYPDWDEQDYYDLWYDPSRVS